jgi:hypothetical protein
MALKPTVALAMFVLSAGSAVAQDLDFTLVNGTGLPIDLIYLAPAGTGHWGPDLLGQYQLGDKDSKKLKSDSASGCRQDIKLVFDDKTSAVWPQINLCESDKIVLHYDKTAGKASSSAE